MTEAANIKLGVGDPPTSTSLGEGTLYFDGADGQLYLVDANGNTIGPITSGGGGGNASQLQGVDISDSLPSTGDVLTYDSVAAAWVPAQPGTPAGGSGIRADNVIYVQTSANGGNDATGERGNSTKPFNTLLAAIQSASNNDIILVGRGMFEAPGSMVGANSSLLSLTIIGLGKETILFRDDQIPCFEFAAPWGPAPWQRFELKNVTLNHTSFSNVITAYGDSATTFFQYSPYQSGPDRLGLYLSDVYLEVNGADAGIDVQRAGYVQIERLRGQNYNTLNSLESLVLQNCEKAEVRDSTVANITISHDFDDGSISPFNTKPSLIERCTAQYLSVQYQAQTTVIDSHFTGGIYSSQLTVAQGGQRLFFDMIGGSVSATDGVDFLFPDQATSITCVFRNVTLGGTSTFAVDAPSVNKSSVFLLGCTLDSLVVGAGIFANASSSRWNDSGTPLNIVTVGSYPGTGGSVRPPTFVTDAVAIQASPAATVIPFGFNLINNSYIVLLESDDPLAGSFSVTSRGYNSVAVTATGSSGITGNVRALVTYIVP